MLRAASMSVAVFCIYTLADSCRILLFRNVGHLERCCTLLPFLLSMNVDGRLSCHTLHGFGLYTPHVQVVDASDIKAGG